MRSQFTYNVTLSICVDIFTSLFVALECIVTFKVLCCSYSESRFVVFLDNCASRHSRRGTKRQRGESLSCKQVRADRPTNTAERYKRTKPDTETSYKTFFFFFFNVGHDGVQNRSVSLPY